MKARTVIVIVSALVAVLAAAAGTAEASGDPAPVERAAMSDDPSPQPGPAVEQAATNDTPRPEIDQGIEPPRERAPILVELDQGSFWSNPATSNRRLGCSA